ncbi:hypothetical protein scyTo_0003863 [Scyliorhinus torazame]|uniref:DNA polymerase n=1 Tax=Scyliorhinus torazame TaxID=75743 RepID=A0A401PNR3_SCYTO|nr:hypothetical protein [Scyliorhinus torazame]
MEPRGIVKAFRKVKRAQDVPPETDGVSQKKAKPDEVNKEAGLSGLTAYIVQAGIGKARTEIFRKQIVQNGGDVSLAFCSAITHVIIDDGMDCERAFRLLKLKVLPPNVQLVRSTWLSLCIAEKRVLSTAGYSVFISDRYLQPELRVKTQGSGGEGQQEDTEISCQSGTMSKAKLNCTEAEKTIVEQLRETTPEENSETGQASAAQLSEDDGEGGSDVEDDGISEHDLQALISGNSHSPSVSNPSESAVSGKWVCARSSERFLTDDLVSREDIGNQKKYLGVCRLPGPGHRHRRLDIIVVPYSEFACALMYFTGSAHFNRSMRALAKTKGMSLSEHTLNCHVLRKGSAKISTGVSISTITEQDIFQQLGLPYREPCERDW